MFRATNSFVRINAYSLEFQLSQRIPIFRSSPAKIGFRRAFNSLKRKKSIHNFTESGPTDQNAYCGDILQHINPSYSENV